MRLTNKAKAAAFGLALASMTVGGALAYFSGSAAKVSNDFHIVAGSQDQKGDAGTIKEPEWDKQKEEDKNGDGTKDVQQAQPGQTFKKDPSLTSNVEYGAVGYIRVKVPTIDAKTDGDAESKVYDTFKLGAINSDFTEVSASKSHTAGEDSVYIYRYNKQLGKGEATPALFEEITVPAFVEIAEGQSGLTDSIDVDAVLLQTEGYATVGVNKAITEAAAADAEALVMFGNIQ